MCQLRCFLQRNHISHSGHVFHLYITIHISLCVSLQRWLAGTAFCSTYTSSGESMLPLHRSPRLGERHRGAKSVNLFRRRRFNIHTQYIFSISTFRHLWVRKLSQSIRKDGIFSTDFALFELCAKNPSEIEIKRELKIVVFRELFFCTQSRVKLRKVTQQFEQHWGIFPASRLK